jgi:hypothetical protein
MKLRSILFTVVIFLAISGNLFSQTKTGTLKIFTEIPGIVVYLDEVKQADNVQEISNIVVGTHYLRVMNKDGEKIYGSILNIVEGQVTSVLLEASKTPIQEKPVDVVPVKEEMKPGIAPAGQNKTGSLNIFSELTGIVVYLDENKQGENIKVINGVPVGSHYLKVLKDGVSVFGELVNISENQVTTVLVKNDGKVEEKILNSKIAEQEEYKNKKLDVILSTGSQTLTKGYSTLYPGYYSYWGTSQSVSNTVQTTDWKIIQGGLKEISELSFASIVGNKELQDKINLQLKKESKTSVTAALIAIPCIILATCLLTDAVGDKPWMHKTNPEHPKWEAPAAAVSISVGTIAYLIAMKKPYSGHYTTVENAARDAQQYNKGLRTKLGLPENYDINK